MLYIGTVILRMDERSFWRCTPRKFFALWEAHRKFNGIKSTQEKQQAERAKIDALGFF